MAILAGGAALRESVTFDEVAHIGAGVSYLQKADLRLNEEHPPLPKILAAVPLVIRGTRADYNSPAWTQSREFFPAYLGQWVFGEWLLTRWNDAASTLAWARLPMLLLTLLLGWVVFVFARRLGGAWGGLLCLTAYTGSSLFLGFGPLVLTDVPVALFSLLALWCFADLWREPCRKKEVLFALSLAGALLSKFTAGLLFIAFLTFAQSTRWGTFPGRPDGKLEVRAWSRARRTAAFRGIFWAAAAVYLFYLVFSLGQRTDALESLGHAAATEPLRRLLMPPWLYLRGFLVVVLTASRPTFLLGHAYPHGVWYYFPVLLVLKSSPGFLGLIAMAAIVSAMARRLRPAPPAVAETMRFHWRILWLSCAVLAGACMLSHFDISFRHFSLPLVLLILLLAPLPSMLHQIRASKAKRGALLQAGAAVLAASCIVSAVWTFPFYFPYTNLLAAGRPAYTLMSDSNVDWNQALPEVKRLAERRGIAKINVDHYGIVEPEFVAPQAQTWDCQKPMPADAGQWAVVSANMILDAHNCLWLMQYPHETLGGGSMYAVRLPEVIPPAGLPQGPPLPSAFHGFLSSREVDLRAMFLDLMRHPERIKAVMDEMRDRYRQAPK